MTIQKTKLMIQFEAETGKNAIWNSKITGNYKKWAAKREGKGKSPLKKTFKQPALSNEAILKLSKILILAK